jgi:DNA-binding SARP family transcriptional activator
VANVVASVEIPVESDFLDRPGDEPSIRVRMLGPMAVSRDGLALALPASRKVRALLAYLAVAPLASSRSQLCELLWDVPDDPRGELRWCLSKIRKIIDEPGRRRVHTREDTVRVDLADCFVDAIEIARAAEQGIERLAPERLRALCILFNGDFLEGLEIDRSPVFNAWLTAQRRRFRGCHAALLEHLVKSVPDDEAFGHLEKWLQLAPFDQHVHELLLTALARRGRIREGEEHLAATAQLFESEGLDFTPIRAAWRAARAHADSPSQVQAAAPSFMAAASSGREEVVAVAPRRASIAVMPFLDHSTATGARGGAADALAHDVITRLAQLRSLFVIAQGTVFALHERSIGPEEAGRMLNVDYVVGGSVRRESRRLTVTVELAETRTARIVWAEVFNHKADDALLVLDEIGNRIVASIASEIETVERNRAILRPPNSLDAWEAHHRGLWHMYRFSKPDNEQAQHFFEVAVQLDPTFARAYAGLSFTHFQNAFQGWAKREPEIDRAFEAAGQSLMVDDRDPAAHWAMGRALWLRGRHDQSVVELEQAIDLSPNFAMGHYTLAFVHSQAGDPRAAISSSDCSRHLSPFDPLLFGMLGARAMALVRLGRFEEAAEWAVKAAARPNAHAHILAIAAFSLALAGSLVEAQAYAAAIHKTLPQYSVADFLGSFRFDPHGAALFHKGAKLVGMA